MFFGQLVLRNAVRAPVRMGMTVAAVAIMVAAFLFPRALVDGQERYREQAAEDRVLVTPKWGWSGSLPLRYAEEVRNVPGILHASAVFWAGLQLPGKEEVSFAANAVEPRPFIAMHPEIVAPVAQKEAFIADEHSMLVSRDLARDRGWKLDDRIVFKHSEHPGEWALTIACIYDPDASEWSKHSLWMHYPLLNRGLPQDKQDKIGFVTAMVADPAQGGSIARAIDRHYDAAATPTLSMEDRVMVAANLGRISAILAAFELVSYLVLVVTLAILVNTLSLNVRERTHELGVLRAIGFGPRHLYLMVLGEAGVLGLCGGALGVALSYPLLEGLVARVLKERLQWPEFDVPLTSAVYAFTGVVALSLLSALWPALTASRLEIKQALGRVV